VGLGAVLEHHICILDSENSGHYQTVGSKGCGYEYHIHVLDLENSGHYQTVGSKGCGSASLMHFETAQESLAHYIHGRGKTRLP
jgi:hypothetical protein